MKYQPTEQDMDRDENNVNHHVPFGDQAERYQGNRACALVLIASFRGNCPPSRELSLALTKVEEALFWANAAIARNEKDPRP
jgi:hypothetical protein